MKSSKLRFVPLVLALGLLATMIPGASAARNSAARTTAAQTNTWAIDTDVSLSYKARRFDFIGLVETADVGLSPDEIGCLVDGRSVKLFKIIDGDPVKKGATTSDSVGAYRFSYNSPQRGKWEVKVAPMTFADRYGDLIECSGARASLRL